jgi:hypothetical protein
MVELIKTFDPWLEAFAVLAALWVLYLVINRSPRFWHLAVGVDGRYSTSRFHGLCWTVVVLACYTATYCARVHVGGAQSLAAVPPNVLTAMGLSLGTGAAAAGITSRRVGKGTEVKAPASPAERGFSRLVTDDRGHPDLAKGQLMAWTLVALAVYLVASADGVTRTMQATVGDPLPAMPDIDTSLLILSGFGQGAYIAHKALSVPSAVIAVVGSTVASAGSTAAAPGSTVPAAGSTVVTAGSSVVSQVSSGRGSATTAAAASASGTARVPGFKASVNGFRFLNQFPHEPDLKIPLPGGGSLPIGDASNGVCGGMVYSARDVFQTPGLKPVTATDPPGPDTPLFHYVVGRLIDSFDLPEIGVLRYYDWMLAPDGDRGWLPFLKQRGVAWRTIVEEWPAIRQELDAGHLACIGLIAVASANPADLGKNHQVMAYGYDVDDESNLTLHLYDPNTPNYAADDVKLSLSLREPTKPAKITHNVGIELPIRGFFMTTYTYHDPTGHLGVS